MEQGWGWEGTRGSGGGGGGERTVENCRGQRRELFKREGSKRVESLWEKKKGFEN